MPTGKPDIVLFMVDQLAAKWLEAASEGLTPTPNVERLRAGGTTFTNTITSNALCSPARSTLATGLATRGHGVLQNGYSLDPGIPTFMQALQAAGWRTGAFGKFHLRPQYESLYPDYRPYGFDVQHITEDARGGEWLEWVAREHPEHLDAVLSTVWARSFPGFARHGPDGENLAARMESIDLRSGTYALPFPEEVSQTNWITGHAVDFITATDAAQPLFAHISYVQPHEPFSPPGAYLDDVAADEIPIPLAAEWVGDPLGPRVFQDVGGTAAPPRDWRRDRQHYLADVSHLDRQLGVVLDTLESSGRADRAYVILLSDHGELLHDHGLLHKGAMHYDACVRVPLMIAGPGLTAGRTCAELVQLEDIAPTVHQLAGLEAAQPTFHRTKRPGGELSPNRTFETFAGRSLVPLCRGDATGPRDAAYVENFNNNTVPHTPDRWARTVRTHEWRYTVYPRHGGEQLFHLREDPDEQRNLAGDAGYAAARRDMRDRLLELLMEQDYPHSPRARFAYGVP